MNKLFSFLFKKQSTEKTESKSRFSEGYDAFAKAEKLFNLKGDERKDYEALLLLDKAIECGVSESYSLRAFILQGLNFHYDAIEDFNNAISISKNDANLYFGRGHSRKIIADYENSISDLKIAIDLSKADNKLNREYNDEMQKSGWNSVTQFYETRLADALESKESHSKKHLAPIYDKMVKEIKRRNKEQADIDNSNANVS